MGIGRGHWLPASRSARLGPQLRAKCYRSPKPLASRAFRPSHRWRRRRVCRPIRALPSSRAPCAPSPLHPRLCTPASAPSPLHPRPCTLAPAPPLRRSLTLCAPSPVIIPSPSPRALTARPHRAQRRPALSQIQVSSWRLWCKCIKRDPGTAANLRAASWSVVAWNFSVQTMCFALPAVRQRST